MKTRTALLGASLLGAGALFVYFGLHHIFILKKTDAASVPPVWESRFDDQGEVGVEVKPLKLDAGEPLQFEISLETHSVELDDDLTQQALLYDEQSHFYKPLGWDGAPAGGHHRSGILIFAPLNTRPEFLELRIKDIGDIPVRSFKWSLK